VNVSVGGRVGVLLGALVAYGMTVGVGASGPQAARSRVSRMQSE
jgi:hypothetical protein